jgi:hypothetical protein
MVFGSGTGREVENCQRSLSDRASGKIPQTGILSVKGIKTGCRMGWFTSRNSQESMVPLRLMARVKACDHPQQHGLTQTTVRLPHRCNEAVHASSSLAAVCSTYRTFQTAIEHRKSWGGPNLNGQIRSGNMTVCLTTSFQRLFHSHHKFPAFQVFLQGLLRFDANPQFGWSFFSPWHATNVDPCYVAIHLQH